MPEPTPPNSKLPPRLVLIGYRGSGKSCVGNMLAEALGYQWLDADAEIQRRAGVSIRDIFQQEGEAGFRQREAEVVGELVGRGGVVVSLGGGAILRPENRQALAASGSLVIWLRADAATLFQRITADSASPAQRPNLTASGGLDEVVALLKLREPYYRQTAHWEIDTEGKSLAAVVAEILARLG